MELSEALQIPTTNTQKVTPCKLRRQQRIDKMLKLIYDGQTDFSKIAEEIGVSRKQAYKYWHQWVDSEEAAQVNAEWWAEYKRQKKAGSPKAFEGITRIKYRMTTEKREINKTVKEIRLAWQVESDTTNKVQPPPETT